MSDIFDKLAKEWDLNPRRVNSAKIFVKALKERVDIRDLEVADYGCGSGLVTFNLINDAKKISAFDNSKGMIIELEKKLKSSNTQNVDTFLHDIEKEELIREEFDLFVSTMTLHHIKDTRLFLNRAKNSLKLGGFIAISDLISEDGSFHSRGNEGVWHFGFDLRKLKGLMESVGFRVLDSTIIESIKKDSGEYPIFLIIGERVE
jgi:2-polyprenyl-3-methyl-5-hydroxy-6-metoxy-1,4-benzoquinol methylase